MAAKTQQEWIDSIQREVKFTQQDLDANRRSQYSDRQRIKLEALVKRSQPRNPGCQRAVILFMLLILFGGLVILNTLLNGLLLDLVSDPTIAFIVGLVLLIIVIFLLMSARTVRNVREAVDHMDKLPLQQVAGVVQTHPFRGATRTPTLTLMPKAWYLLRRRRQYKVTLEGRDFILSGDIGLSFLEWATYRVYYVEFAYITFLLSVDLLAMPVL